MVLLIKGLRSAAVGPLATYITFPQGSVLQGFSKFLCITGAWEVNVLNYVISLCKRPFSEIMT